jgi:hypothetical protein
MRGPQQRQPCLDWVQQAPSKPRNILLRRSGSKNQSLAGNALVSSLKVPADDTRGIPPGILGILKRK